MAAQRTPVSLTVGGQSYRVVASVPEPALRRLAAVVDARVQGIAGRGRSVPPTAILLAAISLANDLEEECARRETLEVRSRDLLRRLLARIDAALEAPGESSPAEEAGAEEAPS